MLVLAEESSKKNTKSFQIPQFLQVFWNVFVSKKSSRKIEQTLILNCFNIQFFRKNKLTFWTIIYQKLNYFIVIWFGKVMEKKEKKQMCYFFLIYVRNFR